MEEIWKDIPGYKGIYQASNTGKCRSIDRVILKKDGKLMHLKGKEQKLYKNFDGYTMMILYKDGKSKAFFAHRIVCKLFLPDFDASLTVNHKDGNKSNNCIDNLEMMTQQENINHYNTSAVFEESRRNKSYKCSISQKGHMKPREQVERQKASYREYLKTHSGCRKGAIIGPELRAKISFAQGIHVRCIETNQYFTSYKHAAEYFHVDITTMIDWCTHGKSSKSRLCPGLNFEITNEPDISKYII